MKKIMLLFVFISLLGIAEEQATITLPGKLVIEMPEKKEDIKVLQYGKDKMVIGSISGLSITETIKTTPDTAEFTVEKKTEGTSLSEVSSKNATAMAKLKKYMLSLGVKESDLTTVSYRTDSKKETKTEKIGESKRTYVAKQSVQIKMKPDDFYNVSDILGEYNIDDLELETQETTNGVATYKFDIEEKNNISVENVKEQMKMKYKNIKDKLSKIGINETLITYFNNDVKYEEQTKSTEVINYTVTNVLKIKVKDFSNIGKIISKGQELKMGINNDLSYSLSDEKRDKLMEEKETGLLNKLTEKAMRLLSKSKYIIGDPMNISTNQDYNFYVRPQNVSYGNYYSRNIDSVGIKNSSNANNALQIETPSEYEFSVTLSASFDVLKDVKR